MIILYVAQIESLHLTKPDAPEVEHVMCFLPRLVGNCSKKGSQAKDMGE